MSSRKVAVTMLTVMSLSLFSTTAFAVRDDWQYVPKKNECQIELGDEDENGKTNESQIVESDGDWLQEGSERYKVAKDMFDVMTKEFGTSGAFASGVIANAKGESDLMPDRAESNYSGAPAVIRFGMNSKTPPDGIHSYAGHNGGGGIIQFTGYEKFTESPWWAGRKGTDGWDVKNQMDAMWGLEFSNRAVEMYMKSTNPSFGAASYGFSPPFSSLEEWLSTNDPSLSARAFQVGYERPGAYHPEREDWAKEANSVFNKDNVKADPKKWNFSGTGTNDGFEGNVIDATSTADDDTDENGCVVSVKDDFDGEFADWGEDGTGTHKYNNFDVWSPDTLPNDLKKYALDPRKLGMEYKSPTGWSNSGDQCVHFSTSFTHLLWEKDGKVNPGSAGPSGGIGTGNILGYGMAQSLSKAYHGSINLSKGPSKGAVTGVPPMTPESPGSAGHTWVVSHVFENGDILAIEQNMSGNGVGSGASGGMGPNTWNYRILTKEYWKSTGVEFYSPADDGYKPSPKILGKEESKK